MHPLLLLALLACGDKDDGTGHGDDTGDGGATDDGGSDGGGEHTTAVVATVSGDYAVGALATVSLADWSVTDSITDISGDPVVVASGGWIFQLNRYVYDTVRVYAPGAWTEPVAEFALEDLANPQDVEVCEGLAFITQYGEAALAVHDPETGLLAGAVDLSAYDDGDGTPEASTMVRAGNGKLYLGTQEFDRGAGWVNVGGHVLEVDCAIRAVTRAWELGTSADVYAHEADPDKVLVHALGDGLHVLDTATGTLSKVLDLGATGETIVGMATFGDHAVVAVSDASYNYDIGCLDLADWSYTLAEQTYNHIVGVAGNNLGEAWISARPHWTNPTEHTGAIVYDIATCSSRTAGAPVSTSLDPFSIAFY